MEAPSSNSSLPLTSEATQIEDCSSKKPPRKRTSKRTSAIWDHFTRVENADNIRAICNYCSKNYSCDPTHGTSTLWAHLTHKCLEYPYKLNKKQKSTEESREEEHQIFCVKQMRVKLAKMIMVDELPFSIVEGEGFKEYSDYLRPRVVIPSRITVARDCLKLYSEEKQKLKSILKSQRVCLTTDTWTSIQNLNYMCLTAHWIDSDWKLHKKILNFCLVPNHKGLTIGTTVEACLLDWGIDHIFTLTVDNASSNDNAIRYLKNETKHWKGTVLSHEYLHVRCCAHILNLIVKDGLDDLDESIIKIRNAVRYVRSSPSRLQIFKKCVEKVKIESKRVLCLDVETRWNSTYKMLEVAEKFEKVFQKLEVEDCKFLSYFDRSGNEEIEKDGNENEKSGDRKKKGKGKGKWNGIIGPPIEEDWKKARCFIKFLKLFYNVTLKFSGSLLVTSNAFFREIMSLQTMIHKLSLNDDNIMSSMAINMQLKFDKYWDNVDNLNLLLYVAIILDPRYKMKYVKFCLEKSYGKEKAKEMSNKVETTLTRLYNYYYECSSTDKNIGGLYGWGQSIGDVNMDDEEVDGGEILNSLFDRHLEEEESAENKSEMVKYLLDDFEPRLDPFDILGWWKKSSPKFPILSLLARDVLAIPISTVASESAFSTGGRVLDPFRSSLSPMTVEALVCGQNWLRSTPIPIDLRHTMDEIEKYEEIETDFVGVRSPIIIEPTSPVNE